jgi:hypothetical protein
MGKPSESLVEFARAEALARKLEKVMRAELRGESPRWIEQAFSPLGPRRHIAAVRRRMSEAETQGKSPVELGAAVMGRRYLLTPESMAEELARLPEERLAKARAAANDVDDEERAYLEYKRRFASKLGGAQ